MVDFDIVTHSLLRGHALFKISPASLAFSLLREFKDYDLQKYNFTFRFVCVRNLVTYMKGRTRLRVFVNEVQGKILGLQGKK